MATIWERAAHLVDHNYVLCILTTVFVILVISRIGFEGGIWVLIALIPGHCIRVTFKNATKPKARTQRVDPPLIFAVNPVLCTT